MNETMIKAHNKIVRPEDIVYHLGDLTFKSLSFAVEIVRRLNGRHYFIRGNHDACWQEQPIESILVAANTILGEGKIVGISDYKEIKENGQHIVLFHFPMFTWHKNHRGSIHLHGHCHGSIDEINRKANVKRIDVGVDSAFRRFGEYRPFTLKEVIDISDKLGIDPPDFFENVGPNKEPEKG